MPPTTAPPRRRGPQERSPCTPLPARSRAFPGTADDACPHRPPPSRRDARRRDRRAARRRPARLGRAPARPRSAVRRRRSRDRGGPGGRLRRARAALGRRLDVPQPRDARGDRARPPHAPRPRARTLCARRARGARLPRMRALRRPARRRPGGLGAGPRARPRGVRLRGALRPLPDRRAVPGVRTGVTRMLRRIRSALTRREWAGVGGMVAVVVGLHVFGWFTLLALVVPAHYSLGTQVFGVGIGVTAYTLGLRHAFDADHIAAIDNTTRKLMADGKRPLSVGFFFSLGHSTVVFGLALLFSLGVKALAGPVEDDGSTLHAVTALVGTGVSGTFLYVIAALNVVVLAGIVRVFREMRRGRFDEAELEAQLEARGLMSRFLGRFTRAIRAPWQMYPLGILFGLGFDTATEVALLFLAAGAAGAGLPWYAILCLPVLFAAGMSLLDTIDGSFMNFAYGWAFSKPVRKVYYNLVVTALSVAVAFIIGSIELLSVAAEKLQLEGGFWAWVSGIDLNLVGYAIVALFAATWAGAVAVWRLARIEEKWAAGVRSGGA